MQLGHAALLLKTRDQDDRRRRIYPRTSEWWRLLHDTGNAIDGELFTACFTEWVAGLCATNPQTDAGPEIVAIDGKTSRRTHDRAHDRNPLHLVSAWASGQRLVLGQQACAAKSNEITAIPLLLDRLAIRGALVTIDAMGVPDQDRPEDPRQRRRLPARREGELAQPACRDRTLLRRPQHRRPASLRDHRRRSRSHRAAPSCRQPRRGVSPNRPSLSR